MENVAEDEENDIDEASNSVQETMTRKEDEGSSGVLVELIDPVDSRGEESTNSAYLHTVTSEDHDVNESVMEEEEEEEEKILEFNSLNDSNMIADVSAMNLNPLQILEGNKSSSSSNEAIEDSSSTSDLDFSLSRYYFDGSLPVSAHIEESETHKDEYSGTKDENQIPLLCPKQRTLQTTSWRNCCGLLELLRVADS